MRNPKWDEQWEKYSIARDKVIMLSLQVASTFYESMVGSSEEQTTMHEAISEELDSAVIQMNHEILILATILADIPDE